MQVNILKDTIKKEAAYNLKIGELKYIKNTNETVWTILGSCISVIFYVKNDLALICHAQYPAPREYHAECSVACPVQCFINIEDKDRFKYVSCSLEYMIAYLKRKKINFNTVHTSLVGGASSAQKLRSKRFNFGQQNILKAKEILNKHNIKINREITGGSEGYTLWYNVVGNKLAYKKHSASELTEI